MNVKKVQYFALDYDELDQVINDHFKPVDPAPCYECVPKMEWNNGSSYTIKATGHGYFSNHQEDDQTIDRWLEGKLLNYYGQKDVPNIDLIMNRLVRDDVLWPGDYLISVHW